MPFKTQHVLPLFRLAALFKGRSTPEGLPESSRVWYLTSDVQVFPKGTLDVARFARQFKKRSGKRR
jgi:hypothetical protein